MKNPDLLAAARQMAIASGLPIGNFNVRFAAFFIGQQFSALAAGMDAIYGENKFALADEIKQWAESFRRGDCDEKVRAGDRKGMLDANIGLTFATIQAAMAQGAAIEAAFAAAINPGPHHQADLTPFINPDAAI